MAVINNAAIKFIYNGKQKQPSFHEMTAVCMFSMNFTKKTSIVDWN
ncbi:hypothetical protein [Bacillus sp. R86525]